MLVHDTTFKSPAPVADLVEVKHLALVITLVAACAGTCLAGAGDPTVGDLDRDGDVDIDDFLALVAAWGPCLETPVPCPEDLDGDREVDIEDLLILLSNWGPGS